MKKMISVFIAMVLCLSLAACSGSSTKVDEELIGKYVCVAGTMMGVTVSGDDVTDFELDLQDKGKGSMIIYGKSYKIKWSNDDDTVTLKIDGVDAVGKRGEDSITFEEFLADKLGVSMDLVFAKEGSDAAKPENYLPEEEKALLGDWSSVSVKDIMGDDASGDVDPNSLTATFNDDHTATISFMGEDIGSFEWSVLSESIIFTGDFDGDLVMSGDYKDGVLLLNYSAGDDYFIFTMENSEGADK